MDRGAWWATVHGVAQSQTRLKPLGTHVGFQFPDQGSNPCLQILNHQSAQEVPELILLNAHI